MPQRTPMQSVIVTRDKKRVTPEIGKPFEFTAHEIAEIDAMNPDALSTLATVDVSQGEKKVEDI